MVDGLVIGQGKGKIAQRGFDFQHQLAAFVEDDGNIGIKGKAQSVLALEDGTVLGTLDYFDVHGAKVEAPALEINGSITEIFCNQYGQSTSRTTPPALLL
jgi:hypothetical protein